ncbi:5-deoxy-glucuronate isomerase [Auraticoccus monumenti]|uniref:5-deoxyglucuronate isomerase n=1 Tax=Auraticoccus monumenti TaxID=675864 RepID=A0A1G6YBW6_9ACTN|nr:5-deoxy-glucuronate isomerase [Auraticoccus monumenti]SDD87964.1 5-deoxyglucuronate isomerase [Auraticoccus monumenti]
MTGRYHWPAASAAGGDQVVVELGPERVPGWQHTGLTVLELAPGRHTEHRCDGEELFVVPLRGGVAVEVGDRVHELAGRPDVFSSATDVLFVGLGETLRLTSADGARVALARARASTHHPVRLVRAEDVTVEVRGAGQMTRLVRNFGTVGAFDDCDALIACEVVTPGGNWSSYPAHKHDEETATESELEEIYYYEVADGPAGTPGFGFHQTTGSSPQRPLELLAEVRSGDVVLVPHGWHGPCAAAPGHDMYYLNVMAGPGERAWDITDHPDQTWVRGTWADLPTDPRLSDGGTR